MDFLLYIEQHFLRSSLKPCFLSSCQNVMFLGDFNAACGYVAKKNWKNIRLFSDLSFIWLIQDNVDTTVKQSTDCAYDRYASKMFILA